MTAPRCLTLIPLKITERKDQRTTFFRDVDGKSGNFAASLVERLIGEEVRTESFAFDGKFLPRAVLEKKGFDMEYIIPRLDPANIEDDSVLGLTYRIPIKSKSLHVDKTTKRQTTATRQATQLKPTEHTEHGPRALVGVSRQLAIEDGDAGSGDASSGRKRRASSSESSSSSSSSSHRRKKSKKDKKRKSKKHSKKHKKDRPDREESAQEKKAREALEKARDREEGKRLNLIVKGAELYLKKMPGILAHFTPLIGNENFREVAAVVTKPVTDAVNKFQALLALAEATVRAGAKNSTAGDLPSFSDLAADIATARKSANLLSSILATMAKARTG